MLNRQYNRTIRWINRAQSRSADGNFSDAILDVECARAELDSARQELLLCHQNGCERKRIMSLPLAALTACVITLFIATPTRMQPTQPEPVSSFFKRVEPPVTAEAQREVPPIATAMETAAETDTDSLAEIMKSSEEEQKTAVSNVKEADGEKSPEAIKAPLAVVSKPTSALSDKDMYRLMEVGRNALRQKNDSVVIEFN